MEHSSYSVDAHRTMTLDVCSLVPLNDTGPLGIVNSERHLDSTNKFPEPTMCLDRPYLIFIFLRSRHHYSFCRGEHWDSQN